MHCNKPQWGIKLSAAFFKVAAAANWRPQPLLFFA